MGSQPKRKVYTVKYFLDRDFTNQYQSIPAATEQEARAHFEKKMRDLDSKPYEIVQIYLSGASSF